MSQTLHFPANSERYMLASKLNFVSNFEDVWDIALIETNVGPSSGSDYINEAKGDAAGTDIFEETYRFNGDYVGVRRESWTADCYPQCQQRATPAVVVVR